VFTSKQTVIVSHVTVLAVDDRHVAFCEYNGSVARIILFQLKKLTEIINLTHLLKSFWILYIDQIIVYNALYSKLTFYIIKDRCQMQALKVFRSSVDQKYFYG
jgi:hypothetical protein